MLVNFRELSALRVVVLLHSIDMLLHQLFTWRIWGGGESDKFSALMNKDLSFKKLSCCLLLHLVHGHVSKVSFRWQVYLGLRKMDIGFLCRLFAMVIVISSIHKSDEDQLRMCISC